MADLCQPIEAKKLRTDSPFLRSVGALLYSWGLQGLYCLDLPWIGLNVIISNQVTQKVYSVSLKYTFLRLRMTPAVSIQVSQNLHHPNGRASFGCFRTQEHRPCDRQFHPVLLRLLTTFSGTFQFDLRIRRGVFRSNTCHKECQSC